MFEDMNSHKHLDVIEVGETADCSFRILIAELLANEAAERITSEDEQNSVLRELLNESTPLAISRESAVYEVQFENYIAYSVINESYAINVPGEEYQGRHARIYSKSAFLEYVARTTLASPEFPGPYRHYAFCCENHIVDVAATESPVVKRVNA